MPRLRRFEDLQPRGSDGVIRTVIGVWASEENAQVVSMSLSNLRVVQSISMIHRASSRFDLAEVVVSAVECLRGPIEMIFTPYAWMAPHLGLSFESKSVGIEEGQKATAGHGLDEATAVAWVRKTTRTGDWPEPILAAARGLPALLRLG